MKIPTFPKRLIIHLTLGVITLSVSNAFAISKADLQKIQYGASYYDASTNASSPSSVSPGSVSGDGAVQGNIVQTALNLAWDDDHGHGPEQPDAKPTYQVAMPKYNGSSDLQPYSDCGVFVATVMLASGADPNYPHRGTDSQLPYLREHPQKYQIFENINDTGQLQPGDILIYNDSVVDAGHTYIFVGPNHGHNSRSASWKDHVPQGSDAYLDTHRGSRPEHFTVARLLK